MPRLDLAHTEILRLRSWLAAERFFRALAKAAPELSRYNPDQPRVPAGQSGGGQWAGGSGTDARPATSRAKLGRAQFAVDITGFKKHGINRAIERGVGPAAILDATKNPQKVRQRPDGTTQYIGRGATVVLDPSGLVITVWPNSQKAWMPLMPQDITIEDVRAILWAHWDPIGLAETDAPRDEYDVYAARIAAMLRDHASTEHLMQYLDAVARDEIGLAPDKARTTATVARLLMMRSPAS
jgi:hypothetical protein